MYDTDLYWNDIVYENTTGELEQVLMSGADPNVHTQTDNDSDDPPSQLYNPLYLAISRQAETAAKLLISYGANIHIDNNGPLHLAICYGLTDIVKILIELGCNNLNDHPHKNLFSYMTYNQTRINYFRKWFNNKENDFEGFLLFAAIWKPKPILLALLIQHGIDLHVGSDMCIKVLSVRYEAKHQLLLDQFDILFREQTFAPESIREAFCMGLSDGYDGYMKLLMKYLDMEAGDLAGHCLEWLIQHKQIHCESVLFVLENLNCVHAIPQLHQMMSELIKSPQGDNYYELYQILPLLQKLDFDMSPYYKTLVLFSLANPNKNLISILKDCSIDCDEVSDQIRSDIKKLLIKS